MGMSDQYDDGRYDGWGPNMTTPTRKKKTVKLTPKQQLRIKESALDSNLTLQQTLKAEEAALREDIRKLDIPNEPPRRHSMFRVEVRFVLGGKAYEYLLMRSGKQWFTTGTAPEQKRFDNWDALCGWLNSTAWHSRLDVLGVDIPGAYPTEHIEEPAF